MIYTVYLTTGEKLLLEGDSLTRALFKEGISNKRSIFLHVEGLDHSFNWDSQKSSWIPTLPTDLFFCRISEYLADAAHQKNSVGQEQGIEGMLLSGVSDLKLRLKRLEALSDLAFRFAQCARNMDSIPPLDWGFEIVKLLATLQEIEPHRYAKEVMGSD